MTRHNQLYHKVKPLHLWHRYLGLVVLVPVLVLSLTGLLLNHTGRLGLSSRPVQSDWLLDWYGIKAPEARSFQTAQGWVTQLGGRLYLDGRQAHREPTPIVGALAWHAMLLILSDSGLTALAPDGSLLEHLDASFLPPGHPKALGLDPAGGIIIAIGDRVYSTDAAFAAWSPVETPFPAPRWSRPQPLPAPLHTKIGREFRGSGLSLERVLLDLHSGRILGQAGVYFMDAAALGLLVLGISGAWLWNKRLRQRHKRKAKGPATAQP